MDFDSSDADERASAKIRELLRRPDQVDNLPIYMKDFREKQATNEMILKRVSQATLEDIKDGLEKLKDALSEAKKISEDVDVIAESCRQVTALKSTIDPIRELSTKHAQYGTQLEHMRSAFEIPRAVRKIKVMLGEEETEEDKLEDGDKEESTEEVEKPTDKPEKKDKEEKRNLLVVHKYIMELEIARNELLRDAYERKGSDNNMDAEKVMKDFRDIPDLSEKLFSKIDPFISQIHSTIQNHTNRKDVVSSLRIVEREEKLDDLAVHQYQQIGFMAPGRPKKWKQRLLERIKETVKRGVLSYMLRAEDNWMRLGLPVLQKRVKEDLLVVKELCPSAFPASWSIYKTYVSYVHRAISQILITIGEDKELLEEKERILKGNDLSHFLAFIIRIYV